MERWLIGVHQNLDCVPTEDGPRCTIPHSGFGTAFFSLPETPFAINMWMWGMYLGISKGKPLTGLYSVAK